MKCETCGGEMALRMATSETPYAYTLSGLKGLVLIGIQVRECPSCKVESPIIPKIGKLHETVANLLVRKKALLTGDELRFLRKFAGFPANRFAALLKIDPAYLSRVENGRTKHLGPSADKLARAIVVTSQGHEESRTVLLELADKLLRQSRVFKLERHQWRPAA